MRRFRRLRTTETMRKLVRETRISPEEMIYPIFVIEGENIKNPIASMPGVFQYSIDMLAVDIGNEYLPEIITRHHLKQIGDSPHVQFIEDIIKLFAKQLTMKHNIFSNIIFIDKCLYAWGML